MFLIAGPTASGKSALALAWAERTGGVMLSNASHRVMAIEYGSSPVELAEHQTENGSARPRLRACSARIGK